VDTHQRGGDGGLVRQVSLHKGSNQGVSRRGAVPLSIFNPIHANPSFVHPATHQSP
jgi:hypothetical protein